MKRKRFIGLLCVLAWMLALSPAGYAAGLSTENTALQVGDTVTIHYSAERRVEKVGAITLFLYYDNSVLQTESIQTQTEPLLNGTGEISCMAADNAETGTITGSWTETDCSMTLDEGTEILTVTFRVVQPTQESRITSRMILKGMSSDDSIGNDDLSDLAGTDNSVLVFSAAGAETEAGTQNGENDETSVTPEENGVAADWVLPTLALILAGMAGIIIWFAAKRKRAQ